MKSTKFSRLAALCLGPSAVKELVEDHSASVLFDIALATAEYSPQEERIGIFMIDLCKQPLEPVVQARSVWRLPILLDALLNAISVGSKNEHSIYAY